MVTYREWQEEKRRWESLRAATDGLCRDIREGRVRDRQQLSARSGQLRDLCQSLFPERLELFDIVYQSRFERLLEQFGDDPGPLLPG